MALMALMVKPHAQLMKLHPHLPPLLLSLPKDHLQAVYVHPPSIACQFFLGISRPWVPIPKLPGDHLLICQALQFFHLVTTR